MTLGTLERIHGPELREKGISVVIPTITGREYSLRQVINAYADTLDVYGPFEILTVKDQKNWPTACNIGAREAVGKYLHFGADDLFPQPDWWFAAVRVAETGELPAARVENRRPGTEPYFEDDGADDTLAHFTRVPFCTRAQYDRIGPWPDIDYYSDVWFSIRGRTVGFETRNAYGYAFVHTWAQEGRLDTPERMAIADAEFARIVSAMPDG